MKINRLILSHFKGCAVLDLDFQGKDATIFARNGGFKTTCVDAILWAFTGKDSSGSADFSIKTLDETGEVAEHGLDHSVEVVIEHEGEDITLRRVWHEVWQTRRGSADRVYSGDESEFYENGVKRTKQEYDAVVAGLVNAE